MYVLVKGTMLLLWCVCSVVCDRDVCCAYVIY